jgi:hypothetical protein
VVVACVVGLKRCILSSDAVTRGKIAFGRHARRIECSIKINFKKRDEGMDYTVLNQGRDK